METAMILNEFQDFIHQIICWNMSPTH